MNATDAALPFFVRAVSPIHVGAEGGIGAINLPCMREEITAHPLIPGSSLKGVLRDEIGLNPHPKQEDSRDGDPKHEAFEDLINGDLKYGAFGPPRAFASMFRSGLSFSDARLLLLPVQSLRGTFAWATSRAVLRRFQREMEGYGIADFTIPNGDDAVVPQNSKLLIELKSSTSTSPRIAVREVVIPARVDSALHKIPELIGTHLWNSPGDSEFFRDRFLVLSDSVFDAFCRTGLEIRARVAIDSDTGIAAASGPWLEEHIPAETVLAGVILARRTKVGRTPVEANQMLLELKKLITAKGLHLRLGGHSSIGLGRAKLAMAGNKP